MSGPPTRPDPGEVTRLLAAAGRGDDAALSGLMPLVYEELRELAGSYLRRERPDHTLQPTALVNEAYVRLVAERERNWESHQHFLALAATAMRRILVNHARDRARLKRGGGRKREMIDSDAIAGVATDGPDLVALDDALSALAAVDTRKVQVVELRYFAGLTTDQAAEVLGVSPATVKRDWEMARAWLRREMIGDDTTDA